VALLQTSAEPQRMGLAGSVRGPTLCSRWKLCNRALKSVMALAVKPA
jgi:hypothetical protein